MKRLFSLVILITFILHPSPTFAESASFGWPNSQEITKSSAVHWGATFDESNQNLYPSHVRAQILSNGVYDLKLCKDANDSFCTANNGLAQMIIPPCSVDSTSMCIEGLSIGTEGNLVPTTLIRTIKSQTVLGNISDQIPNGYNQSLWAYKGGNEFASQNFSVYVLYRKNLNGPVLDFQVQVNAYSEISSTEFREQTIKEAVYGNGNTRLEGSNPDRGCVWIEEGKCGKPEKIQDGLRLELSLRVFDGVTGWLSGRLKNPDISIKDAGTGLKQLVVSAEPVNVPKAFAFVKYSEVTPQLKAAHPYAPTNNNQSMLFTTMANDSDSLAVYDQWLEYWPKNAFSTSTIWGFNTLRGQTHPCLSDKSRVIGLVTTNAMAYDGRPPQFVDGEIQYRVASVHNDETGKQLQGVYDLVIDSKVARCLYNYSSAPISASVSITSSEGNQNIATTIINEKNGWFRMGAYGFHYSSPTIKVKLTQEKTAEAAKPTPSPTSEANTKLDAKKTITCVKGKTTKKVAAVNPKCPVGYKKK